MMKSPTLNVFAALLCGAFLVPTGKAAYGQSQKTDTASQEHSQTIYFGGDIITMNGDSPTYAEAIVESDGKIVFVGSRADAFGQFESASNKYDLNGKTLLPGFIDGHSHIYGVGLVSLMANILPPPDGPGADFDSIVETTKAWMETDDGKLTIKQFGWVMANGYDDSQLAEKEHPTADVLDKISTEYPVIIMHQSGHLAVVNSKGLEVSNYTKDTKDPKGGILRRRADGSPNGVLEEAAFFNIALPIMSSADDSLKAMAVQKGQEEYVRRGYTTAQDGRTTSESSVAFATAANEGRLFIDIVSYPDIIWNSKAMTSEFYNPQHKYNNHYRIGGVKLTLDGSPQGKTAWLTEPYFVPPSGETADYDGYPILSDDDATGYVKTAFKNKWQIMSHTNGDAAIEQYLKAVAAAESEFGYDDHRTVLIHGQTLRKDQIPTLVELDIYPSLFPMHTFYWGDWHVSSVLGHPRADYISPTRDVVDAGRTITSHHDAPVTFPSAMRVLDATVNRVTRSGVILGPDQRLTAYEGLKTLTEWASLQYFEEDSKGTLSKGKLADFVILMQNPLKVDPLTIKDITVFESIKEGNSVFRLQQSE